MRLICRLVEGETTRNNEEIVGNCNEDYNFVTNRFGSSSSNNNQLEYAADEVAGNNNGNNDHEVLAGKVVAPPQLGQLRTSCCITLQQHGFFSR